MGVVFSQRLEKAKSVRSGDSKLQPSPLQPLSILIAIPEDIHQPSALHLSLARQRLSLLLEARKLSSVPTGNQAVALRL